MSFCFLIILIVAVLFIVFLFCTVPTKTLGEMIYTPFSKGDHSCALTQCLLKMCNDGGKMIKDMKKRNNDDKS